MKKISVTLLMLVLVFPLFGAGEQEKEAVEQEKEAVEQEKEAVELSVGSVDAVGSIGAQTVNYMAEYIGEKSDGKIILNSFPANQLGQPPDMIDQVSIGALDIIWADISNYGPIVKDYNIFGMGYVFRDQEHLAAFLESPDYERMKNELREEKGLLTISSGTHRPPRHVFSKKPIHSADDFVGMDFRVPGLEMYLKTFEGIGTNPVRIAYGEAYMALKQGLVDAIENPIDAGYGMKFHQVAKYFVPTGHIRTVTTFVINEDLFSSLSPEYKELIRETAAAGDEFYMELIEEETGRLLNAMEDEGAVILSPIDVVPLQQKLATVAKELEDKGAWTSGLWERIQAID